MVAMVAMVARAGAKAVAEEVLEGVSSVEVAMAAEVMVVEALEEAATARASPVATEATVVA